MQSEDDRLVAQAMLSLQNLHILGDEPDSLLLSELSLSSSLGEKDQTTRAKQSLLSSSKNNLSTKVDDLIDESSSKGTHNT